MGGARPCELSGRARQRELLAGARPSGLKEELVKVAGASPNELKEELVRVSNWAHGAVALMAF